LHEFALAEKKNKSNDSFDKLTSLNIAAAFGNRLAERVLVFLTTTIDLRVALGMLPRHVGGVNAA